MGFDGKKLYALRQSLMPFGQPFQTFINSHT